MQDDDLRVLTKICIVAEVRGVRLDGNGERFCDVDVVERLDL